MQLFSRPEPLPDPLPAVQEKARLDCLDRLDIVGAPGDPAIENLVECVARFFRVPMVMVSMVDQDKQWIKARFGLDTTETDRSDSICQYTIAQSGLFVVRDTHEHAEFRSCPMVAGYPFVRFYAGSPVIVQGQHAVGALCILDRKPHAVGEKELRWLRHFSSILSQMIEINYLVNEDRLIQRYAPQRRSFGCRVS
ncbi:GAF domain-containing protein [Henriciella sp.]|uniref:GAF domain-containing protein n=1 Tax=Henriciella sp. TaxID=1968823 RepID=UPI00261248C7|nr:GAF domain-containing protein [Henriciella sp.]